METSSLTAFSIATNVRRSETCHVSGTNFCSSPTTTTYLTIDVIFVRLSGGIHCTLKVANSRAVDFRCRLKYCMSCLKNRYDEDMDAIKSGQSTVVSTKKEKAKHVAGAGYYYKYDMLFDVLLSFLSAIFSFFFVGVRDVGMSVIVGFAAEQRVWNPQGKLPVLFLFLIHAYQKYLIDSNLRTLTRKAGVESPTELLKDPKATVG